MKRRLISALVLASLALTSAAQATLTSQEGNIRVHLPAQNDQISNPLIVEGEARVFENTVNYRLRDSSGQVLAEGFTQANSPDIGRFGPFSLRIPFQSSDPQLTLQIFTISARDGSEIERITIPIRNLQGPVTNQTVPLYRLYHPELRKHFYTTNLAERDAAITRLGFRDEGSPGMVHPFSATDRVPLYRLHHPSSRDHFYTTDVAEKDRAITQIGYRFEAVAGYVLPQSATNYRPLFRLYNPTTRKHFYTPSAAERDQAVARFGYRSEGIAGYIR